MTPEEFASHIVRLAAAEAQRLQVQPPEREAVGVAVADGLQIVVSIVAHVPAKLSDLPGVELLPPRPWTTAPAAPSQETPPVEVEQGRLFPPAATEELGLGDVHRAILRAATDKPAKMDVLAARSIRYDRRRRPKSYGNNPHFRNAVYELVEADLLVQTRGGYRLPRGKPAEGGEPPGAPGMKKSQNKRA